jgi:hypothetical protein
LLLRRKEVSTLLTLVALGFVGVGLERGTLDSDQVLSLHEAVRDSRLLERSLFTHCQALSAGRGFS